MSAESKPQTAAVDQSVQPVVQPPPTAANVPAVPQAPKPPLVSGGRVGAIIPTDVEQVFRLAQAIAAAGWAPKSYLVDPRDDRSGYDKNKIVVGIMQGMEVGLSPMASLQSIAVINGMPSLWGDGALAVVRASGQLVDIREDVFFDDKGNADSATCTLIRAGQATPISRTFTRAQAQKAGLTNKKGPWQDYPQRMLQMRARAWAMRDGFADILRGMAVGEEAEDIPRDITAKGSHTTIPEPRRADFVSAGGGYDPEAAAQPAARPSVTDAVEQGDDTSRDDDTPTLYELFDHSGEQIGEYAMPEWVGAYDSQMPRVGMKKERALHYQNNIDSAKAIWHNGDCPEDVRKALVERFADLKQTADLLSGAAQ